MNITGLSYFVVFVSFKYVIFRFIGVELIGIMEIGNTGSKMYNLFNK